MTFFIESLEEAIALYGTPEIFNSDQGSQFTSSQFTDILKDKDVKISMDGKGRCYDNIFVERLWRSVKYELIYIKSFDNGVHLKKEVGEWFRWYNNERPHQSLDYQTPSIVYKERL